MTETTTHDTITIELEGGLIQNVSGIPAGVRVTVMDFDTEGASEEELTSVPARILAQPDDREYAFVTNWDGAGAITTGTEQDIANARAIAQLPALLEAVRNTVIYLGAIEDDIREAEAHNRASFLEDCTHDDARVIEEEFTTGLAALRDALAQIDGDAETTKEKGTA